MVAAIQYYYISQTANPELMKFKPEEYGQFFLSNLMETSSNASQSDEECSQHLM